MKLNIYRKVRIEKCEYMKIETFRTAGQSDSNEISRLINIAYRPEPGCEGWTHEASLVNGDRTNPDQISSTLLRPDSVMLLSLLDNLIVACIHIEKSGMDCHIGMFAVNPTLQDAGVGKQILELAERYANDHFCSKRFVITGVSARQELISFYLRRGYRQTGRITNYPLSAGVGTPKQADLKIETLDKLSGIAASFLTADI